MKQKYLFLFCLLITCACQAQNAQPESEAAEADGKPPSQQPAEPAGQGDRGMTGEELAELIRSVDKDALNQGPAWQFSFQERQMMLVYDENADRMRIISPVAAATSLDSELMLRLLQANYDSALDARYGVANNIIWSVFIHPLSAMDKDQFASAVVQVYNVAESFGTTFSSGLFTYGGGDSAEENRKLLEELRERLNPTT